MDDTVTTDGQTAPAATPAAPATPTATPPPETFVNADGTFKPNWQNNFVPEEHRKNTAWLGVKSVNDLVGQYLHAQSKLSAQGKGVFPLTEKSTPEQVKEFRSAFAIPEKPEGYQFTPPAEVAKYYENAGVQEFNATAHKLNLTPAQYAGVLAHYAGMMQKSEAALQADPVAYLQQAQELALPLLAKKAEAELKAKWGDAYPARLNLANKAIEENVANPAEKAELLKKIGNDPVIADFLATVMHKLGTESHGIDTSLGHGFASKSIDQRIVELRQSPHFLDHRTNPEEHRRIVEEINRLTEQKYAAPAA